MPRDERYAAFISYRHLTSDRRWARWLHSGLETYRIPSELKDSALGGRRVGRVFRDEEELAASADLSASIDAALKESRYLVVVCSLETPGSKWVDAEIQRFREWGREDHILALLTEGEPADSFPPALCQLRGVDQKPRDVEPLAADVRPHAGERPATIRRMARLRIIATLLGCSFDELRNRDNERRVRRLIVTGVWLSVLIAVLAGLATTAYRSSIEADEQRGIAENNADEVKKQSAAILEDQGLASLAGGDVDRALPLFIGARKMEPEREFLTSLIGMATLSMRARRAVLAGHRAAVTVSAYSDDGTRIATSDSSGVIRIWDARQAEQICAFRHADDYDAPRHLRFLPGGGRLLEDGNGVLRLWDVETRSVVRSFRYGHGELLDLDVTVDGARLVTASSKRLAGDSATVITWDVETGGAEWFHETGRESRFARFLPGGSELLFAVDDLVLLWDMVGDREIRRWKLSARAKLMALSGESRLFAVSTGRKPARLFCIDEQDPRFTLRGIESVRSLSFSADGRRLLVAKYGKGAIFDTRSGSSRVFEPGFGDSSGISKDGSHVLSSTDQVCRVWDVESGRPLADLRGHWGRIIDSRFAPASGEILTISADRRGIIWDWRKIRDQWHSIRHGGRVNHVRFVLDGQGILTAGRSGVLRIWDAAAEKELALIRHPQEPNSAIYHGAPRFSLDEKGLVLATAGPDKTARLWDVATGRPQQVLEGHDSRVSCVAISPNGNRVVTGSHDRSVILWRDGEQAARFQEFESHLDAVEFSPDGQCFFASDMDSVRVFDLKDRAERFRIDVPEGIDCRVMFAGHAILVADSSRYVHMYDAASGRRMRRFGPHAAAVQIMTVSSDLNVLATFGDGGVVKFWELETGSLSSTWENEDGCDEIALTPDGGLAAVADGRRVHLMTTKWADVVASIESHSKAVRDLCFSRDGFDLASASHDGVAQVRRVFDPKFKIEEARAALRNLAAWNLVEGRLVPTSSLIDAIEPTLSDHLSAGRPPSTQNNSVADKAKFGRGIQLLEDKAPEKAEEFFSQLLVKQPANAELRLYRATARFDQGHFARALEDADEALRRREPTRIEIAARTLRGIILVRLDRLEEAYAEARRLLALRPIRASDRDMAAVAARKARRHLEAMVLYQEQTDANAEGAHLGLGRAYLALRRFDLAIEAFDRASRESSADPDPYFYKGLALSNAGRPDEAVVSFTAAIDRNRVFPEALNLRGLARQQADPLDHAVDDFTSAIELHPKFSAAYKNRSAARLRPEGSRGDPDAIGRSIADTQRFLELNQFGEPATEARKLLSSLQQMLEAANRASK